MTGPGPGVTPRLGGSGEVRRPPGVRVVLDARPIQDPERAPVTAAYLSSLLAAFDADPLEGESFAFLLQSDLDDPTRAFANLDVVGRRLLPPTRLLRSGALTIDPFLLRGAAIGAAWNADQGGAAGAVYHVAGGGPLPIGSSLPVVATLLDLAPWEVPGAFQRSPAGRFGQRLRAQLLREAAAVLVGSEAAAGAARRTVHVRRDRLHVVRLAARPEFRPDAADDHAADPEVERVRGDLGITGRYLVLPGRYDVRQDVPTLLAALALLAGRPRPGDLPADAAWPPRVLVTGASPADRASFARAANRFGVGEALRYSPVTGIAVTAGLVRDARAVVVPVISEAVGLPVIESLATGTPVVATATGVLPELVGDAGLLVEPRDPDRLATALATIWADDRVESRVRWAAMARLAGERRTWADVATGVRWVYAQAGAGRAGPRSGRGASRAA